MADPPGKQDDHDAGGTPNDHEEASADAGAEAVDLSQGDEGRGEGEPRGTGASEEQVEVVWPALEDVKGVLWELASALYDSPEEAFPSFAIESQSLLESALGLPHLPYYETFEDKLAAMVRSIAANHSLVDGNKRLALAVLHSTLLVNGYVWFWPDEAAEELVLRAASGETDFRWLARYVDAGIAGPAPSVRDLADSGSPDALADVIQLMESTVRAGLIEAVEKIVSGDEFFGPGSPDVVAEFFEDAYVSVAKGEHETILEALQAALGAEGTDE